MSIPMLDAILQPLRDYYEDPEYEEIAVNNPGTIWCRLRRPDPEGRIWIRARDDNLTKAYLIGVCHAVANSFEMAFHPTHPQYPKSLFASLPPQGHRFAAVAGSAVMYDVSEPDGGVALCIRQAPSNSQKLYGYEAWNIRSGQGIALSNLRNIDLADPTVDAIAAIRSVVEQGVHLLVSGATSTGKTNLLNRIISELSPLTRIITIEDTREIRLPNHPNHVHLMLSRTDSAKGFSYANAIDIVTRFTPDVVLVGEISMTNAAALWEIAGTGHGAMMCTIHASSPEEAYKTLIDRIAASATYEIDRAEYLLDAKEKFAVLQLERDHMGNRRLVAIQPPAPPRYRPQPAGIAI